MLDAKIQRKGHKLFIDPSTSCRTVVGTVQALHETDAQLRLHSHGRQQALARNRHLVAHGHRFLPAPRGARPRRHALRRTVGVGLTSGSRWQEWDLARGLPHPPRHGEFHRTFMAGCSDWHLAPSFHWHSVLGATFCVPRAVGLRPRRHQGVAEKFAEQAGERVKAHKSTTARPHGVKVCKPFFGSRSHGER